MAEAGGEGRRGAEQQTTIKHKTHAARRPVVKNLLLTGQLRHVVWPKGPGRHHSRRDEKLGWTAAWRPAGPQGKLRSSLHLT